MPRRQFVQDLVAAQNGMLPQGISQLAQGEDDGQVVFLLAGENGPSSVKVTALIPDLGEYPANHEYMIFADDSASRDIAATLEAVRGTDRKTVFEMLDIVSSTHLRAKMSSDGDSPMAESDGEDFDMGDDDDDDIYDSDHEAFAAAAPKHNAAYATSMPTGRSHASTLPFRNRIRSDLQAVKLAGFKVGSLGHLLDGYNAFVSIAIRMSKLGISDEAMQAWQVEPSDYLILLTQYPNGYKTNEELQGYDGLRLAPNIGFRVVAGKCYKPTLQEAIKAFTIVRKSDTTSGGAVNDIPGTDGTDKDDTSIRNTFISKPLTDLLQERLVPLLRFRSAGLPWHGAESMYRQQVKDNGSASNVVPDSFYQPEEINHALPPIVNADHYATPTLTHFSFPLLAAQFLVRHFVRCTEFCLVCHEKLGTGVEAIKPYVCESHLCLFQYMTLGFGQSIEHEILAQPYVVDLLISFCYKSSSAKRLKEFPDGLSLIVPPVDDAKYPHLIGNGYYRGYDRGYGHGHAPTTKTAPPLDAKTYEVGFNEAGLELIFWDKSLACPVKSSNWIVLTRDASPKVELHCRVVETTFFPSVKLGRPVVVKIPDHARPEPKEPETPTTVEQAANSHDGPNWVPASFQIYDQDFQQLQHTDKCIAICRLLETLPNVSDMKTYLSRRNSSSLKEWVDRISPHALSVLRWIIASNRACIMQVDGNVKPAESDDSKAAVQTKTNFFGKDQERLFGMKDYMQFRFAMGAPDKEQRFMTEVRNTTARLSLKHPTLFAFHGSPLYNWHMIIREGLHYKNADHGRAYGDGVYHAKEAQTSMGYSGVGHAEVLAGGWPNSVLKITSAMALNEIVNAPAEYQSRTPYFVVQQLDWIQTRYLFVKCTVPVDGKDSFIGEETMPLNAHPQDPSATPKGISDKIVIPASAIKSHKILNEASRNPIKKLKLPGGKSSPIVLDDDDDDDCASIATDAEDLELLFEESSEPQPVVPSLSPSSQKLDAKAHGANTDFVPGSLDFSSLPLMPLPTYASPGTTKRLMKELNNLQKVQEGTPLAELGWNIDVEKIENVYQWIVELHSFHTFEVKGKKLPLAEDMKNHKIKSIVLEIRFNKDFPFTPPYVRVVRPRFRTLAQGGGGHIVMGGAMCMELLTNTGWSSVSTVESVLMQVRMAIASEPYARLAPGAHGDYGVGEAAEGYMRACQTHGWQVPPGFKEMAYGSISSGS